jgi:ABC-type transporter Mla MlaB component
MIRVLTETRNGRTILRVDGQLDVEGSTVLQRACEAVTGELTLNLVNVTGVDRNGIRTLLHLAEKGVELKNVPPYITLRLSRQG